MKSCGVWSMGLGADSICPPTNWWRRTGRGVSKTPAKWRICSPSPASLSKPTPSLSLPEHTARLAEARQLTAIYQAGGPDAAQAFRDLITLLLRLTVLAPEGAVRFASGPRGSADLVLGGWGGPDDPLPLRDGRYLRLAVRLYLAPPAEQGWLKVFSASYQYQMDREGDRWVFRYDYLRTPPHPHPAAHLQINGSLTEECLPPDRPLSRVHFQTARVSLEAVIRLLADQFQTPCGSEPDVW